MSRVLSTACLVLLVLSSAVVGSTVNTKNATLVRRLVGMQRDLPLKLWSGFANVTSAAALHNQEMYMHYMMYESSKGIEDPSIPIIVWFNGGPGAPSSWGLFLEGGPFLLNEESFAGDYYKKYGEPELIKNKFAFTEFAILIALDSPPPCGFSFCSPAGPGGDAQSCGAWNDTRVGKSNAETLRVIFEDHFPGLLKGTKRDVFFIGESYGGVYITETAMQIVENPLYKGVASHLQGIAVGDACMGTDSGICSGNGLWSDLLFLYGHGQIPTEMWDSLLSVCTISEIKNMHMSAHCKRKVHAVQDAVGEYYTYNLNDDCPDNMFSPLAQPQSPWFTKAGHQRSVTTNRVSTKLRHMRNLAMQAHGVPKSFEAIVQSEGRVRPHQSDKERRLETATTSAPAPLPHHATHLNGYWCMGSVFEQWVNYSTVRTQLNVPQDSFYFIADDAVGMIYDTNDKNSFPFVARLLDGDYSSTVGNRTVRVMSYNGDADPCVNMFMTQDAWFKFAKEHNYTKTSEWHNWFLENEPTVAGGYEVDWLDGQLKYTTVRGSGHMVPEYRPRSARSLMERFVKGS